jgi:putative intracellular protease/amidase
VEGVVYRIARTLALVALLVVAPYRISNSGVPVSGLPVLIQEIDDPYGFDIFDDRIDSGSAMTSDYTNQDESMRPIRILLLMDDGLGANYDMKDTFPCIKEQFEQYGWKITTAALKRRVERCDYCAGIGLEPVTVDYLVGEINDVSEYDIVCLLPGNTGMSNLLASPAALDLVRTAAKSDLVVAAWCKSVRVLAAAGLLDGLDVVGHAEFKKEYEAAGATWLGNDHPPITQGNIITSVRSRFYRTAMCEAMRKAVTKKKSGQSSELRHQ